MVDIPAGSVTNPGLRFEGTSTGLYLRNPSEIGVAINAKFAISVHKNALAVSVPIWITSGVETKPAFAFGTDQGTGMYRVDNGLIAVSSNKFKVLELLPATEEESIAGTNQYRLMTPAMTSITVQSIIDTLTKSDVGLANVNNTADMDKPVSIAQQTALNLKANISSPTFTGTVSGITKTMVGLDKVDNTADSAKPVSSVQQTALNLKANIASPTFTGTVSGITKTMVGLGSVDNTTDLNKPVSTAVQTALDGKQIAGTYEPARVPASQIDAEAGTSTTIMGWSARRISQAIAALGSGGGSGEVTKESIGLGNVDNTSDMNKPISTAVQSALDGKQVVGSYEPARSEASQVVAEAGTDTAVMGWSALRINQAAKMVLSNITKADIGLNNVDNTTDLAKPISNDTRSALDLKANLASPTFTGTVFGITKEMVGLGFVDNTADLDKAVSNSMQTALNLKANLDSPTFTGTVSGITKAMVGLGSVTNTADSAKPVSTAQQAALDLKLDKSANLGDLANSSTALTNLGIPPISTFIPSPVSTNTVDLNTILTPGWHTNLVKGTDTNGWGGTDYVYLLVLKYSSSQWTQIGYGYQSSRAIRVRNCDAGTWSAWTNLGAPTVSSSAPSGGFDGDVWYQI